MTSVYLFLAHGVLALGMGLVPALVTTFRSDYELSGGQIANVQNLKDVGLITAMLAGPAVLRRIGVAAMTMLALLVGLSGCAVLITAQSLPGLLGGVFLHGAAFSFGCLATVSYLFRLSKRYHRISALYATFGVANFVAPFMVGLLVPVDGDYRAVYAIFAAALAALVAAGMVLNRSVDAAAVRDADRSSQHRLTLERLRAWLPDLSVYATLMAGETIVVSWVTTLGQYRYGLTLSEASILLALLWAAHTSARLAGDFLVKHMSVAAVVLSGVLLVIIGDVLLCVGSVTTAYVGVLVFAVGAAPLVPLHQGWTLSRTPVQQHGPLNASLGVGSAALTTAMVWLTGLTVDIDTRIPFVVSAACSAGLALWALRHGIHRTKAS
ncbi:MFS transporter (plasmid) [Streptomyces sp. NBC_01527]|uniref:MFS transporter n=1 Tax=unclassified Streptomyces TaxID=2593676 RepID=UPI002E11CB86|nr:MFS transporter [Streptomyces sp. NBC_01230]